MNFHLSNHILKNIFFIFIFLFSSEFSQAEPKTLFANSPFEHVKLNLYVAQPGVEYGIPLKEQSIMATAIRQAFMFGYAPTIYFQVPKPPYEFYQDKYGRPSFDENSLIIKIALSPHMSKPEDQLITDFWNALQVNHEIQKISLELTRNSYPVLSPAKYPLGADKFKIYLHSLLQRFSVYNPQWQSFSSGGQNPSAQACSRIY